MVQKGTFLKVIDNSGAKKVCCIHIVKGYRKRYAFIGDLVIVSVKSLRSKRRLFSRIKKGEVLKALIIRTKRNLASYSSESLEFFENSVILLNAQNKLIGTRIFGAIPKFFRNTKYLRIMSLASGFIK